MIRESSKQYGRYSLGIYLGEISKIPLLTREEEKELGRRALAGDEEARIKLVESNLRFVVNFIKKQKYTASGIAFNDLIHEGNLGLIEAAKRFDPSRNTRFLSYAVWWVRQAVLDYIAKNAYGTKLPCNINHAMSRVARAENKSRLTECGTSEEDSSARGNLQKETISGIHNIRLAVSLTDLVPETNRVLAETIQGNLPSPESEAQLSKRRDSLLQKLSILSSMEENVIRWRFGLDGGEPMTLQQIGDIVHLSRERIRQLEAQALRKLRTQIKLTEKKYWIIDQSIGKLKRRHRAA